MKFTNTYACKTSSLKSLGEFINDQTNIPNNFLEGEG